MFKIVTDFYGGTTYIGDGGTKYLHSDGSVTRVAEYFETPADAQRVLDKYYPKPKHVWKHGDMAIAIKSGGVSRLFIEINGVLRIIDRHGCAFNIGVMSLTEWAEKFGYVFVNNIFKEKI